MRCQKPMTLGRNSLSNLPWVQFYGDLDSVSALLGHAGQANFYTFFFFTKRGELLTWEKEVGSPRRVTHEAGPTFLKTSARPAESTLTIV